MSVPGKRSGAIDTLRETWDFALGMFRFAEDQEAAIAVDQDFDAALSDLVALLEAAKTIADAAEHDAVKSEWWVPIMRDKIEALAAAVRQVEGT